MLVRDPVTKLRFDASEAAATRIHAGETLYFESQESVDEYDTDPHYYGHPELEEDDIVDERAHHHH